MNDDRPTNDELLEEIDRLRRRLSRRENGPTTDQLTRRSALTAWVAPVLIALPIARTASGSSASVRAVGGRPAESPTEEKVVVPTAVVPTAVVPTAVVPTALVPTALVPTAVVPTAAVPTAVVPTAPTASDTPSPGEHG